jgi:hypothetical protein
MEKSIKQVLLVVAGGLVLLLVVIAVNQVTLISQSAALLHPVFGLVVAVLLTALLSVAFLAPVVGFFRMKKAPERPDPNDAEACRAYLEEVRRRLKQNTTLRKTNYKLDETKPLPEQVDGAMAVLAKESKAVMNETASTVFITTAVSQNGTLDGLFVLTSLMRMVWKISHLYNQRPSIREVTWLYANVAATVLMAREIEDLALLDEQLEPIISSLLGSTLSSMVPGTIAVTNLIVNSVIEGSANAFLTLRVGAMAKQYSAAVTKVDRRSVKRYAILEACALFGGIVGQNSVSIIKAFALASKRAAIDTPLRKMKEGATKTGAAVSEMFGWR